MSAGLQYILDQLPEEHELKIHQPVKSINKHLRQAMHQLLERKRESYQNWNTFLEQKIIAHKMIDSSKAFKAVTKISKSEITLITYKKIRRYLKKNQTHEIQYVDVPVEDGYQRITDRNDMEKHLLLHHKQHFLQAQHTPLATKAVINRFGLASDTPYAHQFCNRSPDELNK